MSKILNLTREMVDPAIYTNNDMTIAPARCQAIHPPSPSSTLKTGGCIA